MVYGIYPGNKKWGGTGYEYSAQGFNSFFEIYWFCFLKKKLLGMPFQVQGRGGRRAGAGIKSTIQNICIFTNLVNSKDILIS